jgi:NAD(P)-dependent dehydrogenase (short-subunit alcohol dehydrogenase family)
VAAPQALVTGASRGIGRATAVALAQAGFDVAVAARTRTEGAGRNEATGGSLPGSIESTCALVEAEGRRALGVQLDLLDTASIDTAARTVIGAWGGVDVLVNNAVHTGDGSMTLLADLDATTLRTKLEANVVAQLVLTQALLPAMLARGGGMIVNLSSAVAVTDPPAPAGEGGWGFAYAASKAAFHRLAGMLAVELGPRGIVAVNVDPGFVVTEAMAVNAREHGLEGRYRGAPPSVPAAVIAWLARHPDDARELSGQTLRAQKVALDCGLHPDWRTDGAG